ncbi:hypothetical protein MGN70_003438 [Eutypa lata]|uniref:Putative ribosomal protein s21 protein n=1 Tax=Eutypa lata (strain UCR-EL1) TaxID=1287681 RepID=M7SHM2_EUTLA|nr:putative ribosomal protein s21 protein [Eutypa lata UCREL1]KAI1255372.1 hypothetical protein MGN70_003438 [Eutypa lata]
MYAFPNQLASDLGRVAHAALRSASLLRPSAPRVQFASNSVIAAYQRRHGPTTPPIFPYRGASLPTQQQHSYSSSDFWTNPNREQRPAETETEVKKPQTSLYYDFGPLSDVEDLSQEIDIEISDLQRKRELDTTSIPAVPKATMRLVPRLGRTVSVSKNVDLARSFKLLGMQVVQNKIRQDFQAQRFHERPGLKRKRLKSERWQRRFRKGFKETVKRVKELTKQGW